MYHAPPAFLSAILGSTMLTYEAGCDRKLIDDGSRNEELPIADILDPLVLRNSLFGNINKQNRIAVGSFVGVERLIRQPDSSPQLLRQVSSFTILESVTENLLSRSGPMVENHERNPYSWENQAVFGNPKPKSILLA